MKPIDRTGWPPGPWDDEPDAINWQDPETGLICAIRRGPLGNLCGYVVVGESHPWCGLHHDAIGALVHGGLTFSDRFDGGAWAVGFDCGHWLDLVPHTAMFRVSLGDEIYRDVTFVRAQVRLLAAQAMLAAGETDDHETRSPP